MARTSINDSSQGFSAGFLGADLDYNLVIVEDGCADRDPEVHQLLMEKVFPRQGTVVSSGEIVEALAAL
jgi:nicotinamidase-related amidase